MPVYEHVIIWFSVVILIQLYSSLRNLFHTQTDPKTSRLPPRYGDQFARTSLKWQIYLSFIIGAALLSSGVDGHDFGYRTEYPLLVSFSLGLLCYAILIAIYTQTALALGIHAQLEESSYLTMRQIWPRFRSNRFKLLIALGLNPFTEETLYRGFLVYYLGQLFDAQIEFIGIGLVVCLIIHPYQDWRTSLFHAMFYLLTVSLLMSPFGIMACFGAHVAGDLLPIFFLKSQLNSWRDRQRALHALLRAGSQP